MDNQRIKELSNELNTTYVSIKNNSSYTIMDATKKHITIRELKPPYEIKKIDIGYFDKYFTKK